MPVAAVSESKEVRVHPRRDSEASRRARPVAVHQRAMVPVGGAARAPAPSHGVDGGDGPPGPPRHHVPPAQLPAPPRLRAGAAQLAPQAAALVGAFVTGLLARKRREQIDGINEKLRQINSEMRRQREEVRTPGWWAGGRAGSPPPQPALAPAPWLAAGGKGCQSPVARAAPPRPAPPCFAGGGCLRRRGPRGSAVPDRARALARGALRRAPDRVVWQPEAQPGARAASDRGLHQVSKRVPAASQASALRHSVRFAGGVSWSGHGG